MPSKNIAVMHVSERFTKRVLAFCHSLREVGIEVTAVDVSHLLHATTLTDPLKQSEFYLTGKIILVKKAGDIPKYDEFFDRFWRNSGSLGGELNRKSEGSPSGVGSVQSIMEVNSDETSARNLSPTLTLYSPLDSGGPRRGDTTSLVDWREQERVIRILRRHFALKPGYRYEPANRGLIDFRRTVRSNMIYMGELRRIVRSRHRKSRVRFLFLWDISGSMEKHTSTMMQLLANICRLGGATEIFAFSTGVARLTDSLRYLPRRDAIKAVSEKVRLWRSGTRIGHCLKLFNNTFGRMLDCRTVTVIVSDGWDLGDVEILRDGLASLREQSAAVIWLNPLVDEPGFEPTASGMVAALDYIDFLASPTILRDLSKLKSSLGRVDAIRPKVSIQRKVSQMRVH